MPCHLKLTSHYQQIFMRMPLLVKALHVCGTHQIQSQCGNMCSLTWTRTQGRPHLCQLTYQMGQIYVSFGPGKSYHLHQLFIIACAKFI